MFLFQILFLRVSNILCLSSGRLYGTCSLTWYIFHAFMQAVIAHPPTC